MYRNLVACFRLPSHKSCTEKTACEDYLFVCQGFNLENNISVPLRILHLFGLCDEPGELLPRRQTLI